MIARDTKPADWAEDHRPPPEARWISDRTDPVRISVRTCFLYSHGTDCLGPNGTRIEMPAVDPKTGRARHAFGRGATVVDTDVPSPYQHSQDLDSNIRRAIAEFGDDADLIIEVRRADEGGTGQW